jgi:hypothetical protein
MNKQYSKPQFGVLPKWLWDEKRIEDLVAAIERKLSVSEQIPYEWIEEYNTLVKNIE